MNKNRLKNSIAYVFLALFISMKLANFHVFTHTEDSGHLIHCMICDTAIANDHFNPVLPNSIPDFGISPQIFISKKEPLPVYHFEFSSAEVYNHLFSRPPPTLS